MSDTDRIQQFRKMAEADPTNELGHFSLGKACLSAGQFTEAATALQRAIELNPNKMSKAYQLLSEALDKAGDRERAIAAASDGVRVADEQGDRIPRDAMIALLKEWGAPVPEVSGLEASDGAAGASSAAGSAPSGFRCSRCSSPRGALEKAPFKGKLGTKVLEHVCSSCWSEWIPMGTKVINELGLVLSVPQGSQTYDQYMIEFLQLEDR